MSRSEATVLVTGNLPCKKRPLNKTLFAFSARGGTLERGREPRASLGFSEASPRFVGLARTQPLELQNHEEETSVTRSPSHALLYF